MAGLDKYIKHLHNRVGDYLFDPEPVHEPLLERMQKEKVEKLYEILSDLRELIVIDELAREKEQFDEVWPDNPLEGGRIT